MDGSNNKHRAQGDTQERPVRFEQPAAEGTANCRDHRVCGINDCTMYCRNDWIAKVGKGSRPCIDLVDASTNFAPGAGKRLHHPSPTYLGYSRFCTSPISDGTRHAAVCKRSAAVSKQPHGGQQVCHLEWGGAGGRRETNAWWADRAQKLQCHCTTNSLASHNTRERGRWCMDT